MIVTCNKTRLTYIYIYTYIHMEKKQNRRYFTHISYHVDTIISTHTQSEFINIRTATQWRSAGLQCSAALPCRAAERPREPSLRSDGGAVPLGLRDHGAGVGANIMDQTKPYQNLFQKE